MSFMWVSHVVALVAEGEILHEDPTHVRGTDFSDPWTTELQLYHNLDTWREGGVNLLTVR